MVKPVLADVIWQIGPKKILRYLWHYHKFTSREFLQKRLFDYINYCSQQPTHDSIISCGQKIPLIVYEWVIGKINSQQLLNFIHADHPAKNSFFDSKIERDLVFAAANLFKTNIHIGIQREIITMSDLFKKCVQKYPGRVHILSNWDLSCDLLVARFAELFGLVKPEDLIFSCYAGCAKPDHEIFNYAAQKFGLQNEQCILIDDMPENINGIAQWGGHGILYIDANSTRRKLSELINE